MKKLLTFFIAIVIALVGTSYFISSKIEQNYNNILANLSNLQGISITNKSYQKKLFSADASMDIIVNSAVFGSEFQEFSNDENLILNFNVKTQIDSGIFALLKGIKANSSIALLNQNFQDWLKNALGSNIIATAQAKFSLDGTQENIINFSDLNYQNEQDKVLINGFILTFSNKQDILNFAKANVGKILINESNGLDALNMQIDELNYDLTYKDGVKFENISNALVPYIANGNAKRVKIYGTNSKDIELNGIKYSSESNYNDDAKTLFGANDNMSVENISFLGLNFKELVLKIATKNLHIKGLNKAVALYQDIDYDSSEINIYEQKLIEILAKISNAKPELNITEFSLKNETNDKLNITSNFMINKQITSLDDLLGSINFNGNLSITPNLSSFLAQIPEVALLGQTMLEQLKILKKQENSQQLHFQYDQQKQDIIINDDINLSELLSSFLSEMF